MLLQSLILVFLKVSISNSYPLLEDNFELVGNGIDSIGVERDCGSKLEFNGAWNGRGTGYLYVPIPMDVETWKVTLTFSSPVTNLQVWDGLNIECNGHVCIFENQGYNEVQSAGTQLKIDFLMDFVSELPDLVGLKVNDVDVCTRIPKVTGNSTLLLVAGGYSSGGPINDIELISGENNTACSRSVKPISGSQFGYGNETFYEGDTLGMTGQFTNEAAIICGGKNGRDNLNTCYEYNPIENE